MDYVGVVRSGRQDRRGRGKVMLLRGQLIGIPGGELLLRTRLEADMTKQLLSFQKFQTMGDSSCENELEELMHQIDIMVNSKKGEWEKQVLVLERRLEAQERELTTTRCALDQKDCEIGVLSKKLEEADKSQQEVVQKYETQLEALKNQLCQLKKSYDKLHYYHGRNHKRDSIDISPLHEISHSELRWLAQKLEEYKDQARQWENQRLLYQNNIKMLNEQRKSLLEKCDHLQKQSQSYEEQLSSRTQLQDEAITNNQSQIGRLRCQLDASQETIRSGRVTIENLKTTVKEITLSRNALEAENRNLLQELRDCRKRCQRMENKLSEATIERQAQEDLSRAAELDRRRLHMSIFQNSQENKFSSQDLDLIMKEQVPNREKVQKRLKVSCKQDQAEKESSLKESRNVGFERLQADVSDLTEQLHRKDITIATISQKVSRLERELDVKEHGNVRQQVMKSAEEPYHFHHATRESEVERHLKNCSEGHELERLESGMMKPVTWQREITGKQSQDKQLRSSEEDKQNMKMAEDDTNNNPSCYQPCDSLLVDQECLDFILPKLRSPTRDDHQFPEMDFTDFSLLICDQSVDSTAVPGKEESFVSAAERFLKEENRRALDFENILNSHIEELQRYSEHTVKRYASHSDHHPAPS